MNELGIYVHIPFCKQKCSYCDFCSFEATSEQIEEYINCVQQEIKQTANKINSEGYFVTTIYIGGGTPSFIMPEYIEKVVKALKENYTICSDAELTIEINPGTVTQEKMNTYQKIGINRISIGLQSTNDRILKQIGRIHTCDEFLDVYDMAKKADIDNINVDLMIGLPNQTLEDVEQSIEMITTLKPSHISVYSLILEEGTKLQQQIEKSVFTLPEETVERKMYWKVKEMLEKEGYEHYEISNFAVLTKQSKHNINCWDQKEYLGFGLAAHSYLNNKRYSNVEQIEEYITNIKNNKLQDNIQVHEIQTIDEKQKEYMLLGLRKIQGVNISQFKLKFQNNPLYLFRNQLDKLVKQELLQVDQNTIKLTNKGIDFANLVWQEFI